MAWWRRPWVACLLLVMAGWGLWHIHALHQRWPPGTVVPFEPEQTRPSGPRTWEANGYRYHALADFHLQARVLSRRDYNDPGTIIAPFDLALGWGVMSNQSVLDQLDISQWGRWYSFRWSTPSPPVSPSDLIRSSSNMHIIPGSASAARAMERARKGSWVDLRGRLVRVEGPNGFEWISSLSRSDTGNGACELFWVDEAIVLDRPPG